MKRLRVKISYLLKGKKMSKKLEELIAKDEALQIVEKELSPLLKSIKLDVPTTSKAHEQILQQALKFDYDKKYQEALPLFLELAEHHVAAGAEYAAKYYFEGLGIDKNYFEAYKMYQLGQKSGSLYCRFRIGYCLFFGLGIQKDEIKGLAIIEETAFMRLDDAIWFLVDLYTDGIYAPMDLEVADFWRAKVDFEIGDA